MQTADCSYVITPNLHPSGNLSQKSQVRRNRVWAGSPASSRDNTWGSETSKLVDILEIVKHAYDEQSNILIHTNEHGIPRPEISDFGRAKIQGVSGFTGSLRTTRR